MKSLPHTRPVAASVESLRRALEARGYDARFVAIAAEGTGFAVYYLGNRKFESSQRTRAAVLAVLTSWGLEVSERGWTIVVAGEITPTAEDLGIAADAAMTRALLAEHGGDIDAVRRTGRIEVVDGQLRVRSPYEDSALALAGRLVAWLGRATELDATAGAVEHHRGGFCTVAVSVRGLFVPARRERCPACAGESAVTGAECAVCNRTGFVVRKAA